MNFVDACRLLTTPSIRKSAIAEAHELLMKFCKGCETLYGATLLFPNMHLHGHLAECIRDFGPIYSFWLFSFERYNGILASMESNKRQAIEVTFMHGFLERARAGDFVRHCADKVWMNSKSVCFGKLRIILAPPPPPLRDLLPSTHSALKNSSVHQKPSSMRQALSHFRHPPSRRKGQSKNGQFSLCLPPGVLF